MQAKKSSRVPAALALGLMSLTGLTGLFGAGSTLQGCKETGPDAPPRQNGCIGDECYQDGSADVPGDGGGTSSEAGVAAASTDPFEGIASKSASLVKDDFEFTEGPVWIGGRLLFSDTEGNTIFELKGDGTTVPFRANAGGPNGNAVDGAGKLVTCESNQHRVVRGDAVADAGTTVVASTFDGKPLNSPNDVVVRKDGTIYFTDPDYQANADAGARQAKQALFRVDTANKLSRVKEYDTKPNGIALSPDQSALYVTDEEANTVSRWAVGTDGTLSGETKLFDVDGPDGMAVDDAGNLYIAASAGVLVFDAQGKAIGTITVAQRPANCAFGGADRKTLYITARTALYSIKLNVPGLP